MRSILAGEQQKWFKSSGRKERPSRQWNECCEKNDDRTGKVVEQHIR